MTGGVYIIGAAMTAFGKRMNDSVKSLTAETVRSALKDADIEASAIEAAWFSNTRQPMLEGQNTVRGEIALRPLGITGVPIANVENACASGSTALLQAVNAIRAGMAEVGLVVGAEKMVFPDQPERVAAAFAGGTDVVRGLEASAELRLLFLRQQREPVDGLNVVIEASQRCGGGEGQGGIRHATSPCGASCGADLGC